MYLNVCIQFWSGSHLTWSYPAEYQICYIPKTRQYSGVIRTPVHFGMIIVKSKYKLTTHHFLCTSASSREGDIPIQKQAVVS